MTQTLDELVRVLAKEVADQVIVELRRATWTVEEWIPTFDDSVARSRARKRKRRPLPKR